MKNRIFKINIIFLVLTILFLGVNIVSIVVLTNGNASDSFYNSLNMASLIIAFVSSGASAYFSMAVYEQSKIQEKINEKLPKKDDQYITENYALFNLETEFTTFSLTADEANEIISKNSFLSGNSNSKSITRFVFLPTNSINAPVYKVYASKLALVDKNNEKIEYGNNSIDCMYAANVLNRGYNCICIDLLEDEAKITSLLAHVKKLEISLDIVSIFNVDFKINFFIEIASEKDTSNNKDKEELPDLRTYLIHHSNYNLQNKKIVEINN